MSDIIRYKLVNYVFSFLSTGKMNKEYKKTGLALGTGAARGLTHIGVLKAIEEYGIKINYISGSSIGALIGGAYAMGMNAKEIEEIALKTNWKLMAKIFTPTLSLSSLVNSDYLDEFLSTIFGGKNFNDLTIPFSAIATDILTGRMVVLDRGDLTTAIRASISLPIIFSPVTYGKYKLLDGGLVNPTPVDIVRKQNIDTVIAVNLRRFETYGINQIADTDKKRMSGSELRKLSLNEKIQYFIKNPLHYINNRNETPDPKFWEVLYQMFIIVQVQISELTMQIAKPDILIEPDTGKYKLLEFNKAEELIEIGYRTAKSRLKKIKS